MRIAVLLCCFFLFTSCDWFASKEQKTQKLVNEEMQTINWDDVDQYPLFEDCDETASKIGQRSCFENTFLKHFIATLEEFDFVLNSDINTSVDVVFLIDEEGQISILNIEKNSLIQQQIPEFDALITQSLKSLPSIEPALKRGIPVKAKFRIPIVLNTQ